MYACLAVTCHLHFWQNDRDFLRATVVTRGWNGYRNKSQHRKSTLEKKILPPFQQGFEPATFQSRVRRSNHWAIPAPNRAGRADGQGYVGRWGSDGAEGGAGISQGGAGRVGAGASIGQREGHVMDGSGEEAWIGGGGKVDSRCRFDCHYVYAHSKTNIHIL